MTEVISTYLHYSMGSLEVQQDLMGIWSGVCVCVCLTVQYGMLACRAVPERSHRRTVTYR
jgi:hypothetical protein